MSAKFDLHKTVFDVSENVGNCTESTHCELPLTFWSEDHVVLEVPEHQPAVYKNGTVNDPCSEESLLTGRYIYILSQKSRFYQNPLSIGGLH